MFILNSGPDKMKGRGNAPQAKNQNGSFVGVGNSSLLSEWHS
jgi:hypothetical protein